MSSENPQPILVGLFIVSFIGALVVLISDFGGYYYYNGSVRVWIYLFFLSDVTATLLITILLIPMFYLSYLSLSILRERSPITDEIMRRFRYTALAGLLVTMFNLIVFFIVSSSYNDYWLDTGGYAAIISNILTVLLVWVLGTKK